jgi:lauroyl/myristoyl acyltransferase|tara:strand:+ start:3759 stop:4415 length:657 start_codon:yes stop_codon:yes gene_type:complete
MFLLSGFVWWGTKKAFDQSITIKNEHYLANANNKGQGVILLAPHFVAMEVAGMYVSSRYPSVSIYQNNRNKVLDKLMLQARSRFGGKMFERKSDLKSLIRSIRDGMICYYLPDQDPGPRRAVFAPFFNVPTATWPVLGRMARMTRAVVLPCTARILEGGKGFEVILDPPLEDFPTGDTQLDSEIMNRAIEQCVRRLPDQYFWVHKRFKTRPPGSEAIY